MLAFEPYYGFPFYYDTHPCKIVQGTTVTWTHNFTEFPGTEYTITYAFQNTKSGQKFNIIASPVSGATSVSVSVPPATSAVYAPGTYFCQVYAVNNSTSARTGIHGGLVIVEEDLLANQPTTHAQRTLLIIEQALEGRLPNGMERYQIDGTEIFKIAFNDLYKLRNIYKAEVLRERESERLRHGGQPTGRLILTRFV